ncbi:MAG: glycosyltransferase family 2 protein [Verrucomicrobiota bacterium]
MISVVIPCYNRRDGMLALLADIYRQKGVAFEVIVVDDCSSDDSVESLRREFPQITLLVNDTNSGPCVTRNRGIRAACGTFVVGFDSDVTIPDRRLLAKVRDAFAESPGASGFAFRILTSDGSTDDLPRWWHPVPHAQGKDRSFATDYFSGTAYAFRREVMIQAGLYPEILYMHYEEVALALRVLDDGGAILYCPGLRVLHHAHQTSRRSEVQVFYKPRNQVLLAVLCFPLWQGVAYLAPRLLCQLTKALVGGHVDEFQRAMRDAVSKISLLRSGRQPLKKGTLRRITQLRRQLVHQR